MTKYKAIGLDERGSETFIGIYKTEREAEDAANKALAADPDNSDYDSGIRVFPIEDNENDKTYYKHITGHDRIYI